MTTQGIGTITINDPLLKALNTYLLRGKDLTWQRFWSTSTRPSDGMRGSWTMCPRIKMRVSCFCARITA